MEESVSSEPSLDATGEVGCGTVFLRAAGTGAEGRRRSASAPRIEVRVFADEPRAQRSRVAYMSHEAMLYDELSAMENLRYFGELQKDGGCVCACTAAP